jgi:hypothetical protein
MRPRAFKMPLKVKLRVFDTEEQTVEFADNATILTVKEWIHESTGVEPEKQRIVLVVGAKVLTNEVALSSDPKHLNLKVISTVI